MKICEVIGAVQNITGIAPSAAVSANRVMARVRQLAATDKRNVLTSKENAIASVTYQKLKQAVDAEHSKIQKQGTINAAKEAKRRNRSAQQ